MMPKRRHTRAHTTAQAIEAERQLNDAYVAERKQTTTLLRWLRRRDREQAPIAGHALEIVSAAVLELQA